MEFIIKSEMKGKGNNLYNDIKIKLIQKQKLFQSNIFMTLSKPHSGFITVLQIMDERIKK